ncbi:Golgi-associated olfactory signaling regulator [Pantherophis guttatus]|uniref:Golgi-associated olfactory signaling regulator n=1 Tax=Pantherophis guttatus TaxID=94885 RepID=A0A6P9CIU2_PANGU|nr:Golgi-associated olfactory signaling regulator [Pantherophis guttatus]
MNLPCVALGLLLLICLRYARANVSSSTSLYSSSSSLPTTLSSTPPMSSESTQDPKSLLHPSPVTNSPPNSSLPQQNQTQPSITTAQTENTELIQEEDSPFGISDLNVDDPIRNYEWEAAARRADMVLNMTEMFQEEERARFNLSGINMEDPEKNQLAPRGMAVALLKPKGQAGETQGISKNAIALFLWVCGILLCVFVGIYCAHSRGSKKEPFTHHRLNEDAFDDPALSLDRPQHYDWFFNETDGYVYPIPTQIQLKPMQVLSVPDLKQPSPGLETSPEKPAKLETGPDTKEVPRSPVKLECLSPVNLGNLI